METKLKAGELEQIKGKSGFNGMIAIDCAGYRRTRADGNALLWRSEMDVNLKNTSPNHILVSCNDHYVLGDFFSGIYGFPDEGRKKSMKGYSPLPWSVRNKVAIGIVEAVDYLHIGTERCIFHRELSFQTFCFQKIPKLCDFGLATWTSAPSVPFICKAAKGTFGYLAPEYFQHGKVSDKTDVYAFGVVLLELITGWKPIEAKGHPREENLIIWEGSKGDSEESVRVEWAKKCLRIIFRCACGKDYKVLFSEKKCYYKLV